MNNLDKQEKARAVQQRIREILMREWDPIGVAGIEGAEDEYDDYAAALQVMLASRTVMQEEIEGYLVGVATGYMGLTSSAELLQSCHRTAIALFARR